MNEQNIEEQYKQTCNLLDEHRLKEALALLGAMGGSCNDWQLTNSLGEVSMSYQYMLQYMAQGATDPQRHKLYSELLAKTYQLADRTRLALLEPLSAHTYFQQRRTQSRLPQIQSLAQLLHALEQFVDNLSVCQLMPNDQSRLNSVMAEREGAQRELFMTTWTNQQWSAQDVADAQAFLSSRLLNPTDLALMVSAVTMSLLMVFDEHKASWLLSAYSHPDSAVSLRALTGFILVCQRHDRRIALHRALLDQLSLLADDGRLLHDLQTCYLQLLQSKDSERINQKLRDEIMPEVVKNMKKMQDIAHKIGMDEAAVDDENPDWQFQMGELMNDRLMEMNRLQSEGADVYLSTFTAMKQFPFFQNMHNWFMPYDEHNSVVVRCLGLNPEGKNAAVSLFLRTGMFCNSDRYSMIYLMEHIPAEQRDMLLGQLSSTEVQMLLQEENQELYAEYARKSSTICRFYVQDLYRFFTLYAHKAEFANPFQGSMHLHRNPILAPYMHSNDLLRTIADFRFKHEQLHEAYEVYSELNASESDDCQILQRMAYCQQKTERFAEAAECLEKANALQPGNQWTLRHLAYCYRRLGRHAEAYLHYTTLAGMQPDNLDICAWQGNSLVAMGRYAEALNCFFKIDLAQEGSVRAWRPIAWCSFLLGKYTQAQKYYQRILSAQPTATDYLNAAHVAWCHEGIAQAIELYRQAGKLMDSPSAFRKQFKNDEPYLVEHGIPAEDISLLPDLL